MPKNYTFRQRKKLSKIVLALVCIATAMGAKANPLLPGYFADPTIQKFGGAYYIYSTSDGIKLASGEPTVWVSYDLENWACTEMDISLPDGLTNCWAPDVVKGHDDKYYYYMGNCQFGCNIYGYVSDNPIGPWTPINEGKPVIPVGTGKEHLPALDAQFFWDDDGSLYAYFGTWCTSFGGMGWVKISTDDMFTIEEEGFIPITQIPHAFEAAYMLKKNDTYILMYSSGDCKLDSYAVQYAHSKSPTGPFSYGENNPILKSDGDLVDGPGHHSVLQDGDVSYIVYHRHDNPHSRGGMFRQTCIDPLVFINDSTLQEVTPSMDGLSVLKNRKEQPKNLAKQAKVEASSFYHLKYAGNIFTGHKAVDYSYGPQHATDESYNTLWKAESATLPQSLTVDLGERTNFTSVQTFFEYPSHYYQYKIEVSDDGKNWKMFADQTQNKQSGSPMVDDGKTKARYLKITVTGVEKSGLFAAIWDVKVFEEKMNLPELPAFLSDAEPALQATGDCIFDVDFGNFKTSDFAEGKVSNSGTIGGNLTAIGKITITEVDKVKAAYFDGKSSLGLSVPTPETLNWNAPFTTSVWVNNPEVAHGECLISWTSRDDMLQASYSAMYYGSGNYGAMAHGDGAVDLPFVKTPAAGKWHHIAVTFDGMTERVYVDGHLNNATQLMLFTQVAPMQIGASGNPDEYYTGYMANLQLYNKSLQPDEIVKLMQTTSPLKD